MMKNRGNYEENYNHEDVEIELSEIAEDKRQTGILRLISWPIMLVVNSLFVLILISVARWIFDETNDGLIVAVICTAYVSAGIMTYLAVIERRINRMEMHSITVHNHVLRLREQVDDMSRRENL